LGTCSNAGGPSPSIQFTEFSTNVSTEPATSIAASSALLAGSINPKGDVGAANFLYGTSPTTLNTGQGCGNDGSCVVSAGSTAEAFSFTPSGLDSNTTYYFQIVFYDAINGNTEYGSVLSFNTLP
jgi:hypothetical protein